MTCMGLLALIFVCVGLWFFGYGLGEVYQLFFAAMPGDEPVPAEYYRRHRGFIVRSALCGFVLAAGYWLAAALAWG